MIKILNDLSVEEMALFPSRKAVKQSRKFTFTPYVPLQITPSIFRKKTNDE